MMYPGIILLHQSHLLPPHDDLDNNKEDVNEAIRTPIGDTETDDDEEDVSIPLHSNNNNSNNNNNNDDDDDDNKNKNANIPYPLSPPFSCSLSPVPVSIPPERGRKKIYLERGYIIEVPDGSKSWCISSFSSSEAPGSDDDNEETKEDEILQVLSITPPILPPSSSKCYYYISLPSKPQRTVDEQWTTTPYFTPLPASYSPPLPLHQISHKTPHSH